MKVCFSFLTVLGFNQTVTKDSDLYRRLIINSEPILFVGESPNRSHTLAFAIMRGSLEGILSTSLNNSHECTHEWLHRTMLLRGFFLSRAKLEGGLSAVHHGGCEFQIYILPVSQSIFPDFDAFGKYVDGLKGGHLLRQVFCNADPTQLRQFVERRGEKPAEAKNIWFQCLWQDWNSPSGSTRAMLCNFFKSASNIQDIGDFVYIGIFDEPSNRHDFSQVVEVAKACGYERRERVDTGLIRECYKFGYCPYGHSRRSLNRLIHLEVTHIFTRT
jgi:hypothetical protein